MADCCWTELKVTDEYIDLLVASNKCEKCATEVPNGAARYVHKHTGDVAVDPTPGNTVQSYSPANAENVPEF
jgi:hypothetical protein